MTCKPSENDASSIAMEADSDGLWPRRDAHSITSLWVFRKQLGRERPTGQSRDRVDRVRTGSPGVSCSSYKNSGLRGNAWTSGTAHRESLSDFQEVCAVKFLPPVSSQAMEKPENYGMCQGNPSRMSMSPLGGA